MRNDKQSERVLIERDVKKTIQILYDKRLTEYYDNADEVLNDYKLKEVTGRRDLI